MSHPSLWKLATHILNEGNISSYKEHVKGSYYNKDPTLHYYVYLLGGKPVSKQKRAFKSSVPTKYLSKLIKLGVPVGRKTINLPRINLSAMDDDTWKYYIQATLTEEGYFGGYIRER